MPELEHDDFALGHGQVCQTPHRRAFGGRFLGRPLEPPLCFQFPRQPPPEPPPIVQCAIAKGADAIMHRVLRFACLLPQREKGLLHHIFGFRMRKPERATIKNQFGRFIVVQPFAPRLCRVHVHASTHRHLRGQICIRKFAEKLVRKLKLVIWVAVLPATCLQDDQAIPFKKSEWLGGPTKHDSPPKG
jgi:hypothetical protein